MTGQMTGQMTGKIAANQSVTRDPARDAIQAARAAQAAQSAKPAPPASAPSAAQNQDQAQAPNVVSPLSPSQPPATTESAVQIVPVTQWTCTLNKLDDKGQVAGALAEPLTVGQKFSLECEGAPVALARDRLSLSLPKEQKYALKFLETRELSETSGKFIAVSYTAAEVKLKNPVLSDGATSVGLGPIQFNVQSVIKPETNPEMKPYPPWAAEQLGLPVYVWVFIAALVAIGAWALTKAIRQSMQRKRLLAELAKHGTALSPYNQFNKELRSLSRKFPVTAEAKWSPELAAQYMGELNQSFRWFLARELVVPAFEFKAGKVARELTKIDPSLYKEIGRDLALALNEIDKSLEAKAKVSAVDAQQLTELCRRLTDRIAKARSA